MSQGILTIREVVESLKVTERTLYCLAQEGRLRAFEVGASCRFERADIESWLEAQKSGTAGRRDAGEET